MKKQMRGLSLIELVIFIVVLGLALSSIFLAFTTALQQSVAVNPQTTANELAQMRMNIILGQRRLQGYNVLAPGTNTDWCGASPPAVCTINAGITGYTVTSVIATYTISGDSNYKIITVTVTGPQSAKAVLQTVIGATI